MVLKLEDLGLLLLRFAGGQRQRRYDVRLAPAPATLKHAPSPSPTIPEHADERTRRRMAEAEHGGVSSEEGTERWLRGENPGGLHHKAPRAPAEEADLTAERQRPGQEEPPARKDRAPRGERQMAASRRGA